MLRPFFKYFSTLFLAILFFSVSTVFAQDVSVQSKLDKAKVTIGELVKYEIIIRFSPDIEVAAPPAGINLGGFEIRNYIDHDPVMIDSLIEKRVEFVIAAYDTGYFVIPPTGIAYMTPDSVADVLMTDAVNIRVESVLSAEAADILDINAPLEIPFDWVFVSLIALLVLFLLAAGWLGYRYYLKRKEGKPLFEKLKEPERPCHETAFEELEKLRNSTLIEDGLIKEYYIELSDIIRLYFQRRYYRQYLEMTTLEIKENLAEDIDEEPVRTMSGEVLDMCDLVKFAKYRPDSDHDQYLDTAVEIVDLTKIIMVSPVAEPDNTAGIDNSAIQDDITEKTGELQAPASEEPKPETENVVQNGAGPQAETEKPADGVKKPGEAD